MPTIKERLVGLTKDTVTGMHNQQTRFMREGAIAAEGMGLHTEQPKDFDKMWEDVSSFVKAGNFSEAVKELGHQIYLNARSFEERYRENLSEMGAVIRELAANPQEVIASTLENVGEKLMGSENNIIKGLGKFLKFTGEFIRNPQQKIGAAFEEVKKSVKDFFNGIGLGQKAGIGR